MADKKQNSTLILKVDLDCNLCYKKIKKVLCKLQEKEDIKAIIYDEKSKSIMLSGPFNPDKVSNWLCCRACKVIKEIEIKDGKPKDSKPADDAKPKGDKPKGDKPKDDKPKDGKAQNGKSKDEKPKSDKAPDGKPKDEKPKGDKAKNSKPDGEIPKGDMPKDKMPKMVKFDSNPVMIPQKAQLEPLKNEFGVVGGYPQMSYQPGWPVGPVGSMGSMGSMGPMGPAAGACCYRPLYEGFYGGCRCCSCGTVQGYGVAAPPVGYYGGPTPVDPYKSSQYFFEEEPTCSIM